MAETPAETSAETLRVFVALLLSAGTRARLAAVAEEPGVRAALRWVREPNLHLTLKFLGELPSTRLPAVLEAVHAAVERRPAMRLAIRGLGIFPPRGTPRVVWAGVSAAPRAPGGLQTLVELHRSLESAFAEAGFEADSRPFRSHVTLARMRLKPGSDKRWERTWAARLRALVEANEGRFFGEEAIGAVSVMRSHLGPSGPTYEELGRFTLAGRG